MPSYDNALSDAISQYRYLIEIRYLFYIFIYVLKQFKIPGSVALKHKFFISFQKIFFNVEYYNERVNLKTIVYQVYCLRRNRVWCLNIVHNLLYINNNGCRYTQKMYQSYPRGVGVAATMYVHGIYSFPSNRFAYTYINIIYV